MSCTNYDYRFKYILVGDPEVGKSCLTAQFIEGRFCNNSAMTIGVDSGSRYIAVGNKQVKIDISDTAGQEQFRSITRSFYRGAAGALLVYDISRRDTLDHVTHWLEDMRQTADNPKMTIMLVGNKCDLDRERRQVSYEEGAKFARDHGLAFLETSAKTAQNVEDAFLRTAEKIHENIQNGVYDLDGEMKGVSVGRAPPGSFQLGQREHRRGGCCGR